jgi:hypothetical protein
MRALVAVVLVLSFTVVPDIALASHGELHGPSSTPLLTELLVAAVVALGILVRHRAMRGMRSVGRATTHAFRAIADHRPAQSTYPAHLTSRRRRAP